MTDIICPLCGKPNPPDLLECKFCHAPLKTTGFLAPIEPDDETDNLNSSSDKPDEVENQPVPAQSGTQSNAEQSIPDWLKETEASFLDQAGTSPPGGTPDTLPPDLRSVQDDSLIKPPLTPAGGRESTIDDDWLANLLEEAGVNEPDQTTVPGESTEGLTEEPVEEPAEEPPPEDTLAESAPPFVESTDEEQATPTLPAEKPEWLTNLEASSKIKFEGGMSPAEPVQEESVLEESGEKKEKIEPEQPAPPAWLTSAVLPEPPAASKDSAPQISPAELPGWLEALRPTEAVAPTGPVEDVSNADIVTAGPLSGLRGVISTHSSAIRARKPPTYSIKLRVTEEQKARVEMMEALLADEEKPTPLPTQPIITSRNIFRIIIAVALLLPIIWMIITERQETPQPQTGNIPGVVDFTQQIQMLPSGAVVLVAFDYEAGFSGELNVAINNVIAQLMNKSAYLTLVATSPSGPALGESALEEAYSSLVGSATTYSSYANLGYIPGGTLGLAGLASSPRSTVPYSLNGENVWAGAPLNSIDSISDFNAVIVLTNDSDTARIWIEQVGTQLKKANKPLLFVSSSQAEPMILPYYKVSPPQIQGLIGGLAGGVAYARSVGNIQQNGVWDAYSIGVTVSVLIIIIGSIASGVVKTLAAEKKKEN